MLVMLLLSVGMGVEPVRAARAMPAATGVESDVARAAPPTVDVHPGMELLAIMAWLAGRYPAPPDSRYKSDVWRHFARYRHHPALDAIRQAALYPDFTETGLWLHGPELTPTLPDSSTWYTSMGRERVAAILRGVSPFAKASHFAEFRARHRAEYAEWSRVVADELQRVGALAAVERFYRGDSVSGSGASVELHLEPLNGWGAHMITLPPVRGTPPDDVVRFQIGPRDDGMLPDSPLRFAVSRGVIETTWHEAGHSFARALLAAHASGISGLSRLFDSTNTNLQRQNVRTWSYAFEENLVRSVVAAMIGDARGPEAMNTAIAEEVGGGFVWVPLLTELLRREYVPARTSYPTLDRFAGRIVEVLGTQRSAAEAPKVPR